MKRQLTDKQVRALRFIRDYIKNNGCAPTTKEIGEALGISSSNANGRIFYLLGHDCLRKTETGGRGRKIALTEKGVSLCESLSKK
jgi:SOS-response transcriptional repressor LexA